MNSRWTLNIGLLLAVALAAATLYVKPRPSEQQSFRLVPAQVERLSRIEIARGLDTHIVLVRTAENWRMETPVAARLDETTLARLLDLTRLETPLRFPTDDLARYALDKPWARVRFNQHVVEFGMTNTVTQELYAKNGEYVYAIPARLAGAIPASAAKLLAHRLFGADEIPIAFRLSRFSLRHDGVRWQLEPPDPGLSQDDLVRWVEQWRLASSLTTQPGARPTAGDSAVVQLRDGRSITFTVVARVPNLVLHRDDEGLEYHFPSRMETFFLASPNVAASAPR